MDREVVLLSNLSVPMLIASWLAVDTNPIFIQELFLSDSEAEIRLKRKKRERFDSHFKRNFRPKLGPPEIALESVRVLEPYLADPNRNYIQKISHCTYMRGNFRIGQATKGMNRTTSLKEQRHY